MKELLEYLARGLVEHPDEVRVEEVVEGDRAILLEEVVEGDRAILLELSVAEDDYGNVIGRGGRTVAALRTVLKGAAARENRRVFVDIVDS